MADFTNDTNWKVNSSGYIPRPISNNIHLKNNNMKIAYHVPTKELWIKKVQEWLDEGRYWRWYDPRVSEELWDKNKENSCVTIDYSVGDISFGPKSFYLSEGFKIMSVKKTNDPETWEAGDTIKSENNGYRKILMATGTGDIRTFILSDHSRDLEDESLKITNSAPYTAFELKEQGCTLYIPEEEKPPREVTMEEVCEKFGEDVKIKK